MLKINEKGQCPICEIKPLVYKGRMCARQYFCVRCSRSYNLDTGEFQENWAFDKGGNSKLRKGYKKCQHIA